MRVRHLTGTGTASKGGADRHGDGQTQRGPASGADPLQHLRAHHSSHRRLRPADGAARHGAHHHGWVNDGSALFVMLDMFSSTAFIILPSSSVLRRRGNLAAIRTSGRPLAASLPPGSDQRLGRGRELQRTMDFFGLDVAAIGYRAPSSRCSWRSGSPHLEKQLRKRIPDALDLVHPHPVFDRHHHRLRGAALHRPRRTGAGGWHLVRSERPL